MTESDGSGTIAASREYTQAGVFTVAVTVTDDDSGQATATYLYVVVYDPAVFDAFNFVAIEYQHIQQAAQQGRIVFDYQNPGFGFFHNYRLPAPFVGGHHRQRPAKKVNQKNIGLA